MKKILLLSRCSKLIAIKLCAISEMHAKVRRGSVAGYATDETLACGPKEHTRWWQRYRGHLQEDGGKDIEDTCKVYCIG